MTRFVVNLDELANLVDRMGRYQTLLMSLCSDADARAGRLDWAGAAAQSHAAAHARWRAGAVEVHEALAVLRSIARTAHGNYLAAVHANQRMWAR